MARRINMVCWDDYPILKEVEYLVCCQNPDKEDISLALESIADRSDIKVFQFEDSGLSRNRNHALDVATAPLIIVSDDDVCYNDDIIKVVHYMEQHPQLAYCTFRCLMPELRAFPPHEYDFSRPYPHYYTLCYETMMRPALMNGVRYSELAGIGAPYLCAGEDELLPYHLRRNGGRGRHVAIDAVEHYTATTAVNQAASPAMIRTKGALMYLFRGPVKCISRVPLEAWRVPVPFHRGLLYLMQGIAYAIKNRRKL